MCVAVYHLLSGNEETAGFSLLSALNTWFDYVSFAEEAKLSNAEGRFCWENFKLKVWTGMTRPWCEVQFNLASLMCLYRLYFTISSKHMSNHFLQVLLLFLTCVDSGFQALQESTVEKLDQKLSSMLLEGMPTGGFQGLQCENPPERGTAL